MIAGLLLESQARPGPPGDRRRNGGTDSLPDGQPRQHLLGDGDFVGFLVHVDLEDAFPDCDAYRTCDTIHGRLPLAIRVGLITLSSLS
jgi:hypothetical protein